MWLGGCKCDWRLASPPHFPAWVPLLRVTSQGAGEDSLTELRESLVGVVGVQRFASCLFCRGHYDEATAYQSLVMDRVKVPGSA